jgi:hypothetical protein
MICSQSSLSKFAVSAPLTTLLALILSLSACTVITPTPYPNDTPVPTITPSTNPTAVPGRITLVLTETHLQQKATDALAQQSKAVLLNTRFDLKPGKILLSGRAKLGLLPSRFDVTAILTKEEGRPQAQIILLKLNDVEAGSTLRKQVKEIIQPYLNQLVQTDPTLYVETIDILDNEIRLSGRPH